MQAADPLKSGLLDSLAGKQQKKKQTGTDFHTHPVMLRHSQFWGSSGILEKTVVWPGGWNFI